jgi:signal transduction histidine kinase
VQIRDLELLVMLRHILLSGRGRAISGARAQQLAELLTEREPLNWFYLQPLRADEHFQGLIGVALSEPRLLPAPSHLEPAPSEPSPELDEAVATWRTITRARLTAVVSAAASEIGQFIRGHAVRELAFEAGATNEAVHLGMDIHDSILPELANVRLQLETLKENAPETLTDQLDRIIGDLGNTAKEARQLAVTLSSAERWRDLSEMMDVVAERFRARTTVPLDVRVTGPRRELGYRPNAQIIRVFQEALNNVWKHAHASHVVAELSYLPLSVRLTVSDDGRGFDPSAIERERLGIRGMERRAKELGGDLRVESNSEGGTTVTLDIPV